MKKITDKMWRDACKNGKTAKQFLIDMVFPSDVTGAEPNKAREVTLTNGNTIPIADISEKQALDFIKMLAPERVWKGFRQ